ncbi:MAG: undecaprenyldiphospho-muramoylpentapeptide beta-N-acetylglucosaminyltransferase [Oscillospiraceae bacterium]
MRILFAGGGTAGHINPGLAIANYISDYEQGATIKFVGTTEGLEAELVPKSGYEIEFIKIHGFERCMNLQNFKNFYEMPASIIKSKKIIKDFKPDVVIGTGGYVSGPVLYAAAKMKIPTLIHESNAFPGITTKILAKYVDTVALGIDDAKKYLKNCKNSVLTGNPVRPSILATGEFEARRRLMLDARPFIVIFGGSLGARDFNKTIVDWISNIANEKKYQIIMGTGKFHQLDDVMNRFKENGIDVNTLEGIKVSEYIYDMEIVMSAADVVVSRAGASTLAELTALGKPAILVPSPYVTGNHQEYNARAIESGGGAVVILEKDFTMQMLNKTILNMTENPEKLLNMKKASKKMGTIEATEKIYNEVKKIL